MQEKDNKNHEITWSQEKVKRLWDFYGVNLLRSQYFSFHSGKYILDYIRHHVKLDGLKSVLDFGCGPGYLLEQLVKMMVRGKCYGLDFSKASVDEINKKLRNVPNFGGALYIDKLPSSFEDNSMDMVISIEVIEHLPDEQLSDMLKEIYRILKPEGYIVITTPNREDLAENKTICPECGCIFHRWQHVRTWNISSLEDLMIKNKFKLLHKNETYFNLPPRGMKSILNSIKIMLGRNREYHKPHLICIGKK